MRIYSFLLVSLLAINDPLFAQSSGSSDERRVRVQDDRPIERALQPSKLLQEMPESVTWDATIGKLSNRPDGGTIHCFAAEGDDLYIAGDFYQFDTVAVNNIVHFNRKTGVWNALNGGPNNVVRAIAVHKGKVYAGGNFSTVSNSAVRTTVNYIAMWDGAKWQGLAAGMDQSVEALAFIDDSLFAGGYFTKAGGSTIYHLAVWNGTSWSEASLGTSYPVYSLLASHDSLFVGGGFAYVGSEGNVGTLANGIALLTKDSWTTFGGGLSQVVSMALFEGKLWCATHSYSSPHHSFVFYGLASWDGSNWKTYGHDSVVGTYGHGDINQLVPMGDTLLALGEFNQIAGVSAIGLAMYHAGSWSQAPGAPFGYANAAISFDGKAYIGGRYTQIGNLNALNIATLSIGGWQNVGSGRGTSSGWESDLVTAIASNDRYVFIGGHFTTIAGMVCNHVAAWDKQTKQWTTLGLGVDGDVYSLAILGNNLLVGGYFHRAGTASAERIAQCNITTKVWSPMGAGSNRSVSAIAADGSNAYAATLYDLEQDWTDYIEKWDGTNWTVFSGGMTGGYVRALALQGTTLYAGGDFTMADGINVNGIAQLQSGSWGALNNGVNAQVNALAVSGNLLYVGGEFSRADGQPTTGFASWDGSVWNPIGTSLDYPVWALVRDGKGGVYVGGDFTTAGGLTVNRLTHWNASTSSFETVSGGVDNGVDALATDTSSLYVGGWLERAGSTTSYHIAALKGAGAGVSTSSFANNTMESVYPDPVVNASTVDITLAVAGSIKLELFNSIGNRVVVVANSRYDAGSHEFTLDANGLPSGLYFLRLSMGRETETQQLVIQR